ncbi:MAG: hypothetical protein HY960_14870 [Ignavibacteriae bacterium]|nr:hypothetical protein [Ignavibacteriota bacterium]
MSGRVLTIILFVALLMSMVIFLGSYANNYMMPGNHQGYEPVQPIAYSHRLHAGELGIACLHCHTAAEQGKHAGIPSTNVCMNCHKFVSAPWVDVKAENDLADKEKRKPNLVVSSEIRKIYNAMALTDEAKPDSTKSTSPVVWKKVHNLPDFVYFNHSVHVSAGVDCQKCHGAVETMERVRQVSDLSMGWCVNCHRDANANGINGKSVHASTDCSACHY